MTLKQINFVLLGNGARSALTDYVRILHREQNEPARPIERVCKNESKQKRAFAGLEAGILVYFP